MDADFDRVTAYSDQLMENFNKTATAFNLLEEHGNKLPTYITQSHIFLMKWDEEKDRIEKGMRQLEELRVFYDGFLKAYDDLIIEVGRRKNVETKMAKVRRDALTKIEKLQADDSAERDAFREDLGDFLPVDIWPGLMAPPKRYEIAPVDGNSGSVPDISASVIQKAIRRVSNRHKQSA
jgi:autophagy-related protein 17